MSNYTSAPPCEETADGTHRFEYYGGERMCHLCGVTEGATWDEINQCRKWIYRVGTKTV